MIFNDLTKIIEPQVNPYYSRNSLKNDINTYKALSENAKTKTKYTQCKKIKKTLLKNLLEIIFHTLFYVPHLFPSILVYLFNAVLEIIFILV